jgi:hypothetical protein
VQDSFVFSSDSAKIAAELKALKSIGASAEIYNDLPDIIKAAGGKAAVRVKNQAMFHVRKFVGAVSEGLNIRENTFVRKRQKLRIHRPRKNTIQQSGSRAPFPNSKPHRMYFVKMYQFRTYLAAAKRSPLPGMFVDGRTAG